jgi:hypothetical protein
MAKGDRMKTAISVLIGLVLGIGCTALWASGVLWWPLERRILINSDKASLDQELQSYKDRLEFFGKRADDLERLLTLLLAGSTIYALAVAYNGYQQAKDAKDKLESLKTEAQTEVTRLKVDTAKDITDLTTQFNDKLKELLGNTTTQIDKLDLHVKEKTGSMELQFKELNTSAESQVERIEEQIARKFPLFKDMDFAITTTTNRILHLVPILDLVESSYSKISPQEKELVLFYEKAMAVFECFDTHFLSHDISNIYRGLGTFYALRYDAANAARQKESMDKGQGGKLENDTDMEDWRQRALFYLNYALEQDKKNIAALNDRAYFALMMEEPRDPKKAKELFLNSIDSDPHQQRALYNLAWLEHNAGRYQQSIDLIDRSLSHTRWQERCIPERVPDLWYQRACSSGCLAKTEQGDSKKKLLEAAMKDLEGISRSEKASWKRLLKYLEDDLKLKQESGAEGDLIALVQDKALAQRLEAAKTTISTNAADSRD